MSRTLIKGLLFNAIAGIALCGAYAPFAWFIIAPPLIAAMFFAWSETTPRKALLYGWIFGFAYFLGSVHWIYFSVHDYGGASVVLSVAIVILLAAILASYGAGLAYCVRRTRAMPIGLRAMTWASLWFVTEWLRGDIISAFPWNLLGQSLVDSPLIGLLPIVGVYGSGWLMVFVGVGLFECARRRDARLFVLPMLIVVIGVTAPQIKWTQAQGEPVRAALIQANVPQAVRFNKAHIRMAAREYARMARMAPEQALVIWPEAAVPILYDQLEQAVLRPLAEELAERGSRLLSGVFAREGQRIYNGLVYLGDTGDTDQFYWKRQLVPFGEYIPGRSLLNWIRHWVTIPMSDLSTGDLSPVLDMGMHQVGVAICYEATFTGLMADAMPVANYFVHLSNDAWFGNSVAIWQHLQIARARAAEFARPVLRATTTGISAIINHRGQVLKQSQSHSQQILVGEIQPRKGQTPYTIWGNWPVILISVFSLIAFAYHHSQNKKR